jgi:hypothetical protein
VGEQPTEVEPPTLAAKVKEEPAVKLEPVESAVAEVEPTEAELKKQSPQEEVEQNKAAEVDPAETNQPFQKENEQNTAAKVDPEETELKKKPFQEEDEQNKLDAEKYRKMKAQKNQREKKRQRKNRRNRKSRSNSSCWRRSSEGKDPERCSGAGKNITFQLAGVETVCMDIALWDFVKPCIASNYDETVLALKKEILFLKHILR